MSNSIFAKDRIDLEQNLDASESNQESESEQQPNYDIVQKQEFQKDHKTLNRFFAKVSFINLGYFSVLAFFTYVIFNFVNLANHFYKSHHLSFYLLPNLIALIVLKMYLAYDKKHSEFVMIPLFCLDLFVSLKVVLGLFFLSFDNNTDQNNGLIMFKILGGLMLVLSINTFMKYLNFQKLKKLTQTFLLIVFGTLYMQIFQRYVIEEALSLQWQLINTLFIVFVSIYVNYQENLLIHYYPQKIYKDELMKIFYHMQIDWVFVFKKNVILLTIKKLKKRKTQKNEEEIKQDEEQQKDQLVDENVDKN